MASSRIDNGARMYDGTRWREVPALTLHPQNAHIHEVPVYAEIQADASGRPVVGWAMHGPQEPLDIGVEAPAPLPDKGINPLTGRDRLAFERARPVPWVHSLIVEWYDPRRDTYWHWEGGVRVHQVAAKAVWYLKTSYGDDGSVSAGIDRPWAINGKIIFIQRPVLDQAGQPVIASSCSSYRRPGTSVLIPGGPSAFTLEHRGTRHYPRFVGATGRETSKLVVRVNEARFNPDRWPAVRDHINRQGMVVTPAAFHEAMHALTPATATLAPTWDTWDVGDALPLADELAGIQH